MTRRPVVVFFLATACGACSAPDPMTFEQVRAAYRSSDSVLLDRYGEPLHELRTDPTRLGSVRCGEVGAEARRHASDMAASCRAKLGSEAAARRSARSAGP